METSVRLLCPDCSKTWDAPPRDLPAPTTEFHCPDCASTRPLSEFLRTERDLETLKQLS